ncbi:MAG: methyltransferase domain-containing protein [Robiginitalea sp.]
MKTYYATDAFDKHVADYEAWYDAYPEVYASELNAVRAHFERLPEDIRGIEVGLGTGRFSAPPYGDMQFDFVLFVTVCHLQSLKYAFREAHRVLKPNGLIIVGFLPKDRPVAHGYQERREFSTFYREAVFYTPEEIGKLLSETGFKSLEFNQVLFGPLENIKEPQEPKPGSGKGSFVVVSAFKG